MAQSPDHPISSLSRQILDELVVEVYGFVEIFDAQALVFAVGPFVIDVSKHTGHAIGGDAGDAQILAVTSTGVHDRDNRNTAVALCAQLFQLAQKHRTYL